MAKYNQQHPRVLDCETESDNTLEDNWNYTITIAPTKVPPVKSDTNCTPMWHGLSDKVSSMRVLVTRAYVKGTTLNNNDGGYDNGKLYNDDKYDDNNPSVDNNDPSVNNNESSDDDINNDYNDGYKNGYNDDNSYNNKNHNDRYNND